MKPFFIALLLPLLALHAQEAPEKATPEAPKKVIPQYVIDLDNLTPEQKHAYRSNFIRANQLFKQKRIFECLEALSEIHKIYANSPETLNLLGACYVEFRDFNKARAAFAKAKAQNPNNPNVLFNQAEIEFVTQNWQESHDLLTAILPSFLNGNTAMLNLIKFKILLCKLKLDDKEGALEIIKDTTFLDDTPLFYYGKGAIAYSEERTTEAETWLARASRVFKNPSEIAPWQDTLIEFGYIKSFYGGDLEIEESPGN